MMNTGCGPRSCGRPSTGKTAAVRGWRTISQDKKRSSDMANQNPQVSAGGGFLQVLGIIYLV